MRYPKEFYRFLKHIIDSRKLLLALAYNDFREQYLGSYLGIVWAILRPTLFVLVIWAVFELGYKSKPTEGNMPFSLWLLCGFIPWTFFVDSVSKSMNSIISSSFLVKKVAFRVSVLPLVKIISALYIHIFLVFTLIVIFLLNGYYPTLYWLQLPYFIFWTVILVLGIGWLTSSLRVFIKDINDMVGVVLQFGFWLTPIFWSIKMIPEQYQVLIKLNPMYYIINGYRNTLINHIWFWEDVDSMLYFLVTTLCLLVIGAITFSRLRPHFGDVL